MKPQTVEAQDSQYQPLGEKPKWSRPGHTIERNEAASSKK
jgi:biotin synthase